MVVAVMAMMAMALAACSNDDDPGPDGDKGQGTGNQTNGTEAVEPDGERLFPFGLFKRMNAASPEGNVAMSPYSLSTALSMVSNGAHGAALEQLLSQLDAEDLSALNATNRNLLNELPTKDNLVTLKISNSFWSDETFSILSDFKKAIENNYKASVNTADLTSQQGVDALNAWCSASTDGMIDKIMNGPKEEPTVAIANAMYFKGTWKYRFDAKDTKDDVFHGVDGDKTVKMMSHEGGFTGVRLDDFSGARMEYGNGAFRMTLLMPGEGETLSEFIAGFSEDFWDRVNSTIKYQNGFKITMPRFSIEYNADNLIKMLAPSMPAALGQNNAYDFIGFDRSGNGVHISDVAQSTVIEVTEEGTAASSATIVEGSYSDPGITVKFDRPFVFVIDEASTGAILFMGAVKTL